MNRILLTSAGFYNPRILEFVKNAITEQNLNKVAVITTAAEGKEENKYSVLAYEQLLAAGFKEVVFFDLEKQDASQLASYDAFYVCGGNTFKLLHFANKSGFKSAVMALTERNGLYIGVSAGSLIMCPSIKIANEIEADTNETSLYDFTGLDFYSSVIFPHYEEKNEVEIKMFETKYGVNVTRLTNSQAILIQGTTSQIIE